MLLALTDEVDIDDRGTAVAFLEVGVGEAHVFQIPPADDAGLGAVEVFGQLGLQVNGVTVLDDADGRAAEDDRVLFGVGRASPGGVTFPPDVGGLLHPGEA